MDADNTHPADDPRTGLIDGLTKAADAAWQLAAAQTREHTRRRHLLAAALLRQRWPTAAQVTADLTNQISGDERGNPWLGAVHDATGTQLAEIDVYDELTDAVAEQLGMVFDFADSPEAAGWTEVRTSKRDLFDPILYILSLPLEA